MIIKIKNENNKLANAQISQSFDVDCRKYFDHLLFAITDEFPKGRDSDNPNSLLRKYDVCV
jgi:hypothetical protein